MFDSRNDFIIAIRYALLTKAAKQKFSLFFLIIFSILIIVLETFSIPPVSFVRSTINDLLYRVVFITSTPGKMAKYLASETKNHLNLYKETEILKEEIEQLKKEKLDALFLKTENENLKAVFGLDNIKTKEGTEKINAKVLFEQSSPYLRSLLINKGTKHGVNKGMIVFSKDYFIGTIVETNILSSRVLLITDLNSKIPTFIQNTDVNAILTGTGDKNNFQLDYLPDNFVLEANKIIYTSGKDGFLNPGLPIAEIFLDKNEELKIRSLADPKQANFVYLKQ